MAAARKSNRRDDILQATAQMLESHEGASHYYGEIGSSSLVCQRLHFIVISQVKRVCLKG